MYDYTLLNYVNRKIKVKIICKIHGIFEQRMDSHIGGSGCKKCITDSKKLDFKNIIESNNGIEKKCDYKLVEYVNYDSKIKIICSLHGIFEQTFSSHIKGNFKCPKCNSRQTSFPEQIIYYYLSKYFKVENRFKINNIEIDNYIDELKLGIEYDGWFFHKDKYEKDIEKNNNLKKLNIDLIRIRENGLEELNNSFSIFRKTKKNIEMNFIVSQIINYINIKFHKNIYLDIDIERDKNDIFLLLNNNKLDKSILSHYPKVAEEWHPTKNGDLKPEFFTYGSGKKMWWLCEKGHEWEARIYSRCKSKAGCSYCKGDLVSYEQSLEYNYKNVLNEFWDYEKNILKPCDISLGSDKKIYCLYPNKNNEYLISVKSLIKKMEKYGKCNLS